MPSLHYKPIGWTPTQLMSYIFKKDPKLQHKKYSFYGKLDPMAHGLMIILWEEECKDPLYINLDKTYQVAIVLGIQTDTYDVMGKITKIDETPFDLLKDLDKKFISLTGVIQQSYPPYSYLKVKGKPLWEWARDGKLDEITIPAKPVIIYSIIKRGEYCISYNEIQMLQKARLAHVVGEFRQEDILQDWNRDIIKTFPIIYLECNVSSGTYIRNLANLLNGFALEIYRNQVDKFTIDVPIERLTVQPLLPI